MAEDSSKVFSLAQENNLEVKILTQEIFVNKNTYHLSSKLSCFDAGTFLGLTRRGSGGSTHSCITEYPLAEMIDC